MNFKLFFSPVLLVALIVMSLTSPVFSSNMIADFEASDEKARIDGLAHKSPQSQVKEIVNYTVDHIRGELDKPGSKFNQYPYKRAMAFCNFIKNNEFWPFLRFLYSDYSPDLIVGDGFRFLRNMCEPDAVVTKENVLQTALTACVLLSPQTFAKEFTYGHDTSIHRNSLLFRNELAEHGTCDIKSAEKFTCTHLRPLVLTGPNAIFTRLGFIYALSHGILLRGVTAESEEAHGGLYKDSLSLITHDLAHENEMMMGKFAGLGETSESLRAQRLQLKDIHINMAGFLYAVLSESGLFSQEETPKAAIAAFDLLHEYLQGADYSYDLLRVNEDLSPEDKTLYYYNWFVKKLKGTIGTEMRLHYEPHSRKIYKALGYSKAEIDAMLDKEQAELDQKQKDAVGKTNYQFNRDHALTIVEVYPEATAEIFPEGLDGFYFSRKAASWTLKLIDWFDTKVQNSNAFAKFGPRFYSQ